MEHSGRHGQKLGNHLGIYYNTLSEKLKLYQAYNAIVFCLKNQPQSTNSVSQ